ncbi:MAG: bifunctional [glutamate--ammonia ligase]-adenylyl-L-tyrosine phosphorylase/[glutamate--ammonia-ligase] adenylyltransferase [Desulfuromonas sp.]|nr:MAG: bifunctional [glutamate--ammonia ligase]-adenylyl-L-tyrosine phosphorylase/[glutamate--ammonia-ligase] adenylyltransferase [Desulfuromonas sp.]
MDKLAPRLQQLCHEQDAEGLQDLARELGYAEAGKTAANLALLAEFFGDPELVAALATAGLEAADPDASLNNLERLSGTIKADELAPLATDPDRRRQLLTVLGASQFLTGTLCRKAHFFQTLFQTGELDRPKTETQMIEELRGLIPADTDFETLQQLLRHYKWQEILRIGSRDLCGMAELLEVTGELSSLAAATLQRAFEVSSNLLQKEHGKPMVRPDEDDAEKEAEFTILGMGKFGGRELNFSSDIDLIYFYSSEKGETTGIDGPLSKPVNRIPVHKYFIKLADMISKAIGQVTGDGFVFRVDLDLRPEGKSGEMAQPAMSAILYYESWGQSWERSALIKARPVAGSLKLGEYILTELEPFIFRRHLDYAMIDDIKGMKQRIDHSLARAEEGEINLKLGRGGIREIEFFVQALQLIYAGKKSSLRVKGTLAALDALHAEGLVKDEELPVLKEAYVFLRTVEHRIQVVQEKQTHNLPTRKGEELALARRCGFVDSESFMTELKRHRDAVSAIFRELFYTSDEEIKEEVRPEIAAAFDSNVEPERVKGFLAQWGFSEPETAYESVVFLRDGKPYSHLTQKARRQMERIAPLILQEVIASPEPDRSLLNMESFLSALRARGTYYALLAENHGIIKLLISLFGTSRFLTRIFIQHPEILDSLVSRSYAKPFKELDEMESELKERLDEASDYERSLETLRRYRNEEFLRIALNDIHGHTPQGEKTYQLSCLAISCLRAAYRIAREELIPRYGLPFVENQDGTNEEAGFCIVGMGKLGGMELNYHSDLDIIFIFRGGGETAPVEGTELDRFKQQGNQQYFSRLAQRIISILTLTTQDGYVYQIDTRLRPSGNQGPLVTSRRAFKEYHQSDAQLWERQALTKALVVCGQEKLADEIHDYIRQLAYEAPLGDDIATEIARLRERMEKEIAKENSETFNIKTGRGGMVDVEFLTQYFQLLHGRDNEELRETNTLKALQKLNEAGILNDTDYEALRDGYKFLRRLENMLRLVHDQSISEISSSPEYLNKLAWRLGYESDNGNMSERLMDDYRRNTENIRTIFNRHLQPDQGSGGTGGPKHGD